MRSRFLFYIFLFLLSSLAIGCYDDEGNYDYKTINEVAVKLEETYGVRKVDTVFVIRPEIRQSLATDTTNLKFEWYYNSARISLKVIWSAQPIQSLSGSIRPIKNSLTIIISGFISMTPKQEQVICFR